MVPTFCFLNVFWVGWAGLYLFYFVQFCDIENFGDLFQKMKRKVRKNLTRKTKISQFVLSKIPKI
jgi:hypothetical protein